MLKKTSFPLYELNILAFASGLFSLCIQVIATHYAFLAHPQSSYAIGLSLFSFLTGLGIASTVAVKYQTALLKNYRMISAWSLSLVGFFFGFLSLFHNEIRQAIRTLAVAMTDSPGGRHLLSISLLSILFLLLPAIFIGIIYPLVNDRRSEIKGSETGKTSFFDYLGASTGALFCSFILVPNFGLKTSSMIVVSLILLASILWHQRVFKVLIFVFTLAFIYAAQTNHKGGIYNASLSLQPQKILFSEPSPYGDVIVIDRNNNTHERRLTIGLRGMCMATDNKSEFLIADIPVALIKRSDLTISNVGLGCGYTARQLKYNPNVSHLDVVEINPQIVKASHFFGPNLEEQNGAKTKIYVDDGYSYLKTNPNKKYDAIVVDVEEPSVIHSSALFTYDYFFEAKKHLNEDGVFSIWNFYQPQTNKIILNSLRAVFKHAEVLIISNRAIFIASNFEFDLSHIQQSKQKRKEVLSSPQKEIATVTNNPYPKYFKVNSVFGLPAWYEDPYEL